MDALNATALETQVREELSSFGIACTAEQAAALVKHLLLVIEKNKVVNLTRITDPVDAVTLHVVDSLLPLACDAVRLARSSWFVDMGTGAGFPGIPLGIMTGAHGLLVDSVNKKVAAVSEFVRKLGASSLHATHARIEECVSTCGERQDYVFARAVAQSNVLIEYATPLLKTGGCLILEKGRLTEEELSHAEAAARLCGLSLVSRETFELPRKLGHREILIYQRTGTARVKLPRKAGEAKRHPLGEETPAAR